MKYLLDTCVCIAMIKGNANVRNSIRSVGAKSCAVSEITVAELMVGAEKSGEERHFRDVTRLIAMFKVLPISRHLASYARIRAHLERAGQRIEDFDMLIGATAIDEKLTMVTANTRHFERIPGIALDNWE
ncbi:MAG: PIN domain-containing protein [Bacteroidaceae bacterium]|nr:PIN domain-containing protein [Bacteroidaceae bacterium]